MEKGHRTMRNSQRTGLSDRTNFMLNWNRHTYFNQDISTQKNVNGEEQKMMLRKEESKKKVANVYQIIDYQITVKIE